MHHSVTLLPGEQCFGWYDIFDYSDHESIAKLATGLEAPLAFRTALLNLSPALGLGMSRSTICRPAVALSWLKSVTTTARLPPFPVRVSAMAAIALHLMGQKVLVTFKCYRVCMKIPKDGFRQSQAQQLPSMPELPSCPQRSYYEAGRGQRLLRTIYGAA